MDDRPLRQITIQLHGIYQKMVRRGGELVHGFAHSDTRSLVNVDLINSGGIDGGNRKGNRMIADTLCEYLATLGQQQLGVAQAANPVVGVKNNGRSYNWPK